MVYVVAGKAYATTTLVLRILLISVFFLQANAFYVQFLLVANESRTYARIHTVTAVFGCAAIVVSAKAFSILGPAISQTGISAVVLIWTVWVIFRMSNARASRKGPGKELVDREEVAITASVETAS